MQQAKHPKDVSAQYMRAEHYRLHCVEQWPDSPYRQALLAGIRSALERLKESLAPIEPEQCIVCASREAGSAARTFSVPQKSPAITRLAA